ncbi:MAG TPA: inositol monophosphatase family protein [Candidatus Dormibacteraeota bacterium]
MRETVVPLAGTDAGRVQLATGAGGDRTMELDRAAEAVIFDELGALAASGERFTIISEEAGVRTHGAQYPLVLVDPVDGSLNAKQGVPFFSVMLALVDGPTIGDTVAGCVMNLTNGETWTAIREQGAWRSGSPLHVLSRPANARIELVALESTPRALMLAKGLVERSSKIRILGSMALAIAHTAAGGFDAFCAPIPMRAFDMTASLLVLAEAGGVASDLKGRSLASVPCGLESTTSLVCAPNRQLHTAALEALSK